ncbi:MAG: primosomal protein N' [Propionibacteriaceae bacterium]|nr:primosomal protein N' [Propionibacteriaceae bacterium]
MIARCYVDVGVPHLDRVFDYVVPEAMEGLVAPGVRVKVPFSGRKLPGYVVELATESEVADPSAISWVSPEIVLPFDSMGLLRAVADHCAGSFMEVARLAVPPRQAAVEKTQWSALELGAPDVGPSSVDLYPTGEGLRRSLRDGGAPRASWLVAPVISPEGDWADGFAALVADTVASSRSALVVVPDGADVARVLAAVQKRVDPRAVAVLSADQGPAARYRHYLMATRGRAKVVVGTRAAAYVPLKDLGLILVWDDADHSMRDQRFPYPHVRDIAAIRAAWEKCGLVFASHSRSAAVQAWVEKDWLARLESTPSAVRYLAARITATDGAGKPGSSRLPHEVFEVVRAGLRSGPVLVWTPWASASGAMSVEEEMRAAFRGETVVYSHGGWPIAEVEGSQIVVATPGCEPRAEGGYAAAVILGGTSMVGRSDLEAGEEAVRRWLDVVSLVRPGRDGGTVLVVGPLTDRAVQAVVRLDPAGFAARELGERREAGLPPAVRMAGFAGDAGTVEAAREALQNRGWELLGPMQDLDDPEVTRLLVRAPAAQAEGLAGGVREVLVQRSSSRDKGKLVVRLDPDEKGWL